MAMETDQEQFEEWLLAAGIRFARSGNYTATGTWGYLDETTQIYWECWQAGAQFGRKSQQERFGYIEEKTP